MEKDVVVSYLLKEKIFNEDMLQAAFEEYKIDNLFFKKAWNACNLWKSVLYCKKLNIRAEKEYPFVCDKDRELRRGLKAQ